MRCVGVTLRRLQSLDRVSFEDSPDAREASFKRLSYSELLRGCLWSTE